MLPGPLKDAVDVETKLQHAGGELCPQQSAAGGLFTESGKNRFVLWTTHVHVAMLLLTTKTSALLYFCVLTVTTSLSPGVVWSGPGLALKLWLLLGELQLDHPVSPREHRPVFYNGPGTLRREGGRKRRDEDEAIERERDKVCMETS